MIDHQRNSLGLGNEALEMMDQSLGLIGKGLAATPQEEIRLRVKK